MLMSTSESACQGPDLWQWPHLYKSVWMWTGIALFLQGFSWKWPPPLISHHACMFSTFHSFLSFSTLVSIYWPLHFKFCHLLSGMVCVSRCGAEGGRVVLMTRLGISTVFESELCSSDGQFQRIKCFLPIFFFDSFATNRLDSWW